MNRSQRALDRVATDAQPVPSQLTINSNGRQKAPTNYNSESPDSSSYSVSEDEDSPAAAPPEEQSSKVPVPERGVAMVEVEDSPPENDIPPKGINVNPAAEMMTGDLYSYWAQRHHYFSKYDEGIWMTDNSWFEVTPEKIGKKISDHIFTHPERRHITVILDAFCGVGGNTIQFALSPHCEKVIAIDSDPLAIACARHNAKVYGVDKKINFIIGDYFKLIEEDERSKRLFKGVHAVFLSPPWGGPTYRYHKVFDLEYMTYPFSEIYKTSLKISKNLAMLLPRSSDLNQLASFIPDGEKIRGIHYCIDLRSKALCTYHGELADTE